MYYEKQTLNDPVKNTELSEISETGEKTLVQFVQFGYGYVPPVWVGFGPEIL